MTRQHLLAIACVALVTISIAPGFAGDARQAADAGAATAAAKASPDLVGALSKELSSTPEQAAGAAGALFGVAKSRMKPGDFSQVDKAVPGMALLLGAAPAMGAAGGKGKGNPLSQMAGLAAAASAFSKLGLKPELVSKAVPVLTSFVGKSGGADVGKLLAAALK